MRTPPPSDLDISIEEDLGHHKITFTPRGTSGARTICLALLATAALAALAALAITPEIGLVSLIAVAMAWTVRQVDAHNSGAGTVELTPTHLHVEAGGQRVSLLLEEIVGVRVIPMCLELTCRDGSRQYVLRRDGSTLAGWLAPRIQEHAARRRAALLAEGHDLEAAAQPPEHLLAIRDPTAT